MTCDTARILLLFYRPGKTTDLAAEDVAALEAHLASCPACAALAGTQTAADAAIGRAFRQVPVPGGLRYRLREATAAEAGTAEVAASANARPEFESHFAALTNNLNRMRRPLRGAHSSRSASLAVRSAVSRYSAFCTCWLHSIHSATTCPTTRNPSKAQPV